MLLLSSSTPLKMKMEEESFKNKKGKGKQRWSEEVTKDFIIDIQAHDCLWDVSSPSFSDRDSKEKALRELYKKYNCTGPTNYRNGQKRTGNN